MPKRKFQQGGKNKGFQEGSGRKNKINKNRYERQNEEQETRRFSNDDRLESDSDWENV